MLRALKNLFISEAPETASSPSDLDVTVAALLIAASRADFEVEAEEMRVVREALLTWKAGENAAGAELDELVHRATELANGSVSIFDFTSILNRELPKERKRQIIEHLWEVAFADGQVTPTEELLVRKAAGLLHVSHSDFIAAKLRGRDAAQSPRSKPEP